MYPQRAEGLSHFNHLWIAANSLCRAVSEAGGWGQGVGRGAEGPFPSRPFDGSAAAERGRAADSSRPRHSLRAWKSGGEKGCIVGGSECKILSDVFWYNPTIAPIRSIHPHFHAPCMSSTRSAPGTTSLTLSGQEAQVI